ncbi:MAG: 6-phosphogluconolactonase [Solirubrobacterales bacterium]|nr:6-phosphogluconolactonase [Solirubrobacterales bacterium]
MKVTRLDDPEAVARYAADQFAAAVHDGAQLGLAGGSTPMRAYALLGAMDLDWTGAHLWYGDERCVPFDHEDSNHGQVLATGLQAPGAFWHPMPGELGPEEGAASYSADLDGTVLDLLHLGMGPDGHTASLFPHHPLLDAATVAAGIADSPKPPPERITLTLPTINRSRAIVLLVTGADKADALARVLAGPDRGTPASLLDRDRLEVVADATALSA